MKEIRQAKFIQRKSAEGKWYWQFISPNGATLVTSETFGGPGSCKQNILTIQRHAATARIERLYEIKA